MGHSCGHTWAFQTYSRLIFSTEFAVGSRNAASDYQYCNNLFI